MQGWFNIQKTGQCIHVPRLTKKNHIIISIHAEKASEENNLIPIQNFFKNSQKNLNRGELSYQDREHLLKKKTYSLIKKNIL